MSAPETTPEDLSQWTAIYTPERSIWDFRLKELWQYRDLILLFFRRDFVTSYKQTVLGPFWFFAQPLMTSAVFTVVFGHIGKITTPGTPQLLFFMSGVILWGFFSNCLTRTATMLTTNSGMFSKVYFPRLVVPLSVLMTNGLTFLMQLVVFVLLFGASAYFGVPVHPNKWVFILPLLLVQIAALSLGVGCIVAALTTRYRDLAMAVSFGVQLWMYASCVVYPLATIGKELRWIFILNPMVPIIESFRLAFLGKGVIDRWDLLLSMGITGVLLVVGLLLFNRVENTFIDTV